MVARTWPTPSEPQTGLLPAFRAHKWFIGAEVILLVVMAAMVLIVKRHLGPLPGDVGLTIWWQHLVRPHAILTAFFDGISTINWPIPAAIALAFVVVVCLLLRRWLDALLVFFMEIADGTNWLINQFVHRPRPAGDGVYVMQHIGNIYSFPSGHVEHALAFLGIVVFLSLQVRRPWRWLWVPRIALIVIIVCMLPSRVLEGEHWPSDGVAGLIWGGLWLLIGIHVYAWATRRWPRLVPANERRQTPYTA